MSDVPRIVADCEVMRALLTDTTELDRQIEEKTQESELLADMVRELIYRNASSAKEDDKKKDTQKDALDYCGYNTKMQLFICFKNLSCSFSLSYPRLR